MWVFVSWREHLSLLGEKSKYSCHHDNGASRLMHTNFLGVTPI